MAWLPKWMEAGFSPGRTRLNRKKKSDKSGKKKSKNDRKFQPFDTSHNILDRGLPKPEISIIFRHVLMAFFHWSQTKIFYVSTISIYLSFIFYFISITFFLNELNIINILLIFIFIFILISQLLM